MMETEMYEKIILINSPVRGEWAVYNPPGHPELAFDLQVMSTKNPFPLFKNLLPFRLSHGKRKTGNEWREERSMALNNGDHLLFD